MSPQSFSTEWMDELFGHHEAEAGLAERRRVWSADSHHAAGIARQVPPKYPIRSYPDITHSRHSQYPVPDWDLAFASTEGREVINPRPVQEAGIFPYL